MESDPRLYNESLFVAREIRELLDNWNWEFRRCMRIVVEERESRKWEYNGVKQGEWELSRLSVGDSHGKLVVEKQYKKSACEDLVCD
jgi:hypothetical protein